MEYDKEIRPVLSYLSYYYRKKIGSMGINIEGEKVSTRWQQRLNIKIAHKLKNLQQLLTEKYIAKNLRDELIYELLTV